MARNTYWRSIPAAERQADAAKALELALLSMEVGIAPFGDWERNCISYGIGCLAQGWYDAAGVEARLALEPVENRSRDYPVPATPNWSMAQLQHSLSVARSMPIVGA